MARLTRYVSHRHLAIALAAALILSLLAPLAGHALAQAGVTATVTTPKLNVRSGPGPGYAVITTVDQGTQVVLLGRNASSSWAKIHLPSGTEGWASTFYLASPVSFSTLPVIEEPGKSSEPTGIVITGSLNIRSGPSPIYSILMTVGYGYPLGLVGRNATGDWLQVRANGLLGWVDKRFISTTINTNSLPVVNVATPTPPPLPASPTPNPNATSEPTQPPPVVPMGPTATVISQRLNVRAAGNPGAPVIGTLVWGNVVDLLGRNQDGSWAKIRTAGGLEGWVSSLYIAVAPGYKLSDMPVLADTAFTGTINTGTVNVREGPGPQFASTTSLNFGTPVTLLARNTDASWVKIGFNGQTGWVSSAFVSTNFSIPNLPVASQ